MEDVPLNDWKPGEGFAIVGWIVVAVAVTMCAISFFLPTTVETAGMYGANEVVNIGRLQTQMIVFQLSVALLIFGGIMLATGAIVRAIKSAR